MSSAFAQAMKPNRPQQLRKPTALKEHPGREVGKPSGVYHDDLWQQKMAIWLCDLCVHKTGGKVRHYHYEKKMRTIGNCDDCRQFSQSNHFFVHESYLVDTGGRSRHGQSWIPR